MKFLHLLLSLIVFTIKDHCVSARNVISLRPGEYLLSVGQSGALSCTECSELYHLINTDGHEVLSLMEIEDKFGQTEEDGSVSNCCVSSLTQEIELIRARIRHERHRMQNKVGLHAQLIRNNDLQLPTVMGFTEIYMTEWSFGEDIAFCQSTIGSMCNFTSHNTIIIPFGGYFTINLRITWADDSPTNNYEVRVHQSRGRVRKIIGYDRSLGPSGSHHHVARIHQTYRLRHGDRLVIEVTHKDKIIDGTQERSVHTFFELEGEEK